MSGNQPTKHDYELTFDRLHEAHGTHLRAAHEALARALAQAEGNDAQFDTFADENPVWKTQTDAMRTNRGELRGQLMRVKAALDAMDAAFEESTHTYRPDDADDSPKATHRQTGPDDPSHPTNWRAAKDQVPSDATRAEMKREGKDEPRGGTVRQTGPQADPDNPNTGKASSDGPQAKVIPEEPSDNPSRQNERPGGAPKPLDRPENKPKR